MYTQILKYSSTQVDSSTQMLKYSSTKILKYLSTLK